MQRKKLFDKISMSMDLPSEPALNQTVVEMFGCSRVLIENHFGITQYSTEEICINVRFGILRINGKNLYIARMSHCRLIICGSIDSIVAQKGE